MGPRRYAEDTSVPIERTQAEIKQLLRDHKATTVVTGEAPGKAMIEFEMRDRRLRVLLPLKGWKEFKEYHDRNGWRKIRSDPQAQAEAAQDTRSRWRALLLLLKSKFASIDRGITVFERAFLDEMVLPDGLTVGEYVVPKLAEAYKSGTVPALMPGEGHS